MKAEDQNIELVAVDVLPDRVRALRQTNARLVQIGATRLPSHLELTYSFELRGTLTNLRLHLPGDQPRVPSISPIYWCAFLYENEMHDLFDLHVDNLVLDFKGTLYTTAVKFPFGQARPPAPPAPAAASKVTPGAPPQPAAPSTTRA